MTISETRNTPYEHESTAALICNLCGQEPCVCGKPSCVHPLSRRVQVWKCADCGQPMPNTMRDVLGDPIECVTLPVDFGSVEDPETGGEKGR